MQEQPQGRDIHGAIVLVHADADAWLPWNEQTWTEAPLMKQWIMFYQILHNIFKSVLYLLISSTNLSIS